MNIAMNVLMHITGGRPMKKLNITGFMDVVSGNMVNYYEDFFGHTYMASSRWGFDRVGVNTTCDYL